MRGFITLPSGGTKGWFKFANINAVGLGNKKRWKTPNERNKTQLYMEGDSTYFLIDLPLEETMARLERFGKENV